MSARALRLLSVLLVALLTGPVHAAKAPAPRAAAFAALPNWTGLWETEEAAIYEATGKLVTPKLWGTPPYNAEWEKKAGNAGAKAGAILQPAVKLCEKAGFPEVMEAPVPDRLFEMLVTPEQTLFVFTDSAIRHIYTDGRQHPQADDLWPTPEGNSIGHWDGETLIIDTIARKAGLISPLPGVADLSEQAHFTERLRLLDADTLQNAMTIDDPQRFSHPWQLLIRYKRAKNVDRMIAVNCSENDRNPVINGDFVIKPP
jgi:hypothetical protein